MKAIWRDRLSGSGLMRTNLVRTGVVVTDSVRAV